MWRGVMTYNSTQRNYFRFKTTAGMSPHLRLLLLLASPLLCAPSISKSSHQKTDLHNHVSQRAATCAGTWPPPATSCATAAPATTPASTSRQGTTTAASRPRQTGPLR